MILRAFLLATLTATGLSIALSSASTQTNSSGVRFESVASELGVAFKHLNGASPDKHLPEIMSAGAVILDFDSDGWPDLFFVNGGSLANLRSGADAKHRLYHNKGNGTFEDVTGPSGIVPWGYGMGACSADYDNDGWADLYITGFGSNRLYHNTGKGAFVDVTSKAGAGGGLWSTSCAFADVDNDGQVDLYVVRYVDFTVAEARRCTIIANTRTYCHPTVYKPVPDLLYHNKGDGTFSEISRETGIASVGGNGLGVVFGDINDDGWVDAFVANDSTSNFLFRNRKDGTFEEIGLRSGVAFGRDGVPMAGMGTDMGDIDGSGRLSILVTNLDQQGASLYRNLGNSLFADETFASGIGPVTLPYVGFGSIFLDYDNDGDLDIAIVNGHVIDNIGILHDSRTYEQPRLLIENVGNGRFRSVGVDAGPGFAAKMAGRALSSGDLDNDGDMDLVVANVGQAAEILRNDSRNRGNSILVRLVGTKSNRDGIGARLKLTVAGRVLLRELKSGSSYLSQSDMRIAFGLGAAASAERLEIRWPSGKVETIEGIEANRVVTIKEGDGVVSRQPFTRK